MLRYLPFYRQGLKIVHSSFWGGDLEALILQGAPRNLFKNTTVILTAGETATHRQAAQLPDGTVIGARGPNGVFAPDNPFNTWFRQNFEVKFNGRAKLSILSHDPDSSRRESRLRESPGRQCREGSDERGNRKAL